MVGVGYQMTQQAGLAMKQTQKQKMTARQVMTNEYLMLSCQKLEETLKQKILSNPLLQLVRPWEISVDSSAIQGDERLGGNDYEGEESYDPSANTQDAKERQERRMASIVDSKEKSLYDRLWEQLEEKMRELDLSYRASPVMIAAKEFLEDIDQKTGMIESSNEEILKQIKNKLWDAEDIEIEDIEMEDVEAGLKLIQSLEPAGVGARTLEEKLMLQLERQGQKDSIAYRICQTDFQAYQDNHLTQLATELGCTKTEINRAVKQLQDLEKRADSEFSEEVALPAIVEAEIYPDVQGNCEVQLRNEAFPTVVIDGESRKEKIKALEGADAESKKAGKKCLRDWEREAEELKGALDYRKRTIQRIIEVVAERQKDFFTSINGALVPLSMKEVADQLKVHESTISRAVFEKYVKCVRGTLPLRGFFSGAISSKEGRTRVAVLATLKEIIEREDPAHPSSDQQLVEKLAKEGIHVARRTVAKYRGKLNFKGSSRRRMI